MDWHRHSMWVTGNTGVPQQPLNFTKVVRNAGTSTYLMEPDSSEWFQFSVPTPTIIADHVPGLDRVWVVFRLGGDLRIDRVDFWDGPEVLAYSEVNFTGDRGSQLDDSMSPEGVPIGNLVNYEGVHAFTFALNVSVRVQSGRNGGDASFVAVGADFSVWE